MNQLFELHTSNAPAICAMAAITNPEKTAKTARTMTSIIKNADFMAYSLVSTDSIVLETCIGCKRKNL